MNPFALMAVFALPSEQIDLEVALADRERGQFGACATGGTLRRVDPGRWSWSAPEDPGVYELHVRDQPNGESMLLRVFVQQPYRGEQIVEGYRIGSYEKRALRNLPNYRMPQGLVRAAAQHLDLQVSPHFTLRQFLCKQGAEAGGAKPPHFLLLSTRLLLKMETLLEEVRSAGVEASTFSVMSAYRTPYYNRKIGNTTKYSRHLYGDAVDIFVDEDRDGVMDDLDGDGRITFADARYLADRIERAREQSWYRPFIGGLGVYGPAPHRGPFVHIDTRGYPARWSSGGPSS